MDNINDKVINIFKAKNAGVEETESSNIKFFAGVDYVRIDEDVNGHQFNKENLLKQAEKYSYIVRVLKPKNGKQSLYNYNVPYDKLVKFISMFQTNELSGIIIEIDKYTQNELA
jgi:hypothetical protein